MFSHDGSVLITGGLGGVGLAMAKWMIEKRDVRHIVLLARRDAHSIDPASAVGKKLNELFSTATKYSATVRTMKADVSDYDQVNQVITDINKSEFPLRGIIHGALVLHDSLITNMTKEILLKVLRPRVRGAWNLHRISCEQPYHLDFFVLLSSLRNHVIDIGGANYNASNQFFDSIAHWRRNILDLPALSISVPAVFGTVYVEKNEDDLTSLHRAFQPVAFEILFELMERFHYEQYSGNSCLARPGIFAVDWNLLKTEFDYTKTARIRDLVDKQTINMEEDLIKERTSSTKIATLAATLNDSVRATIAKIFGSLSVDRIDVKKSLVEQGMDSLMAVSLHNWLGSYYSVFIPVVDITQGMSIEDIVNSVNAKLANLSQQNSKLLSSEKAAETTQTVINRMEIVNEQLTVDFSPFTRHYRGVSLTISFPTISTDDKLPILFCICDDKMKTEQHNSSFASVLASKMKHFSQVCAFLRPAADDKRTFELIEEYIMQMRRTQPRGPY